MFTATLSENAKASCLKYMRSVVVGFELSTLAALHRNRRQKIDAARLDAVLYTCHGGGFDGSIRLVGTEESPIDRVLGQLGFQPGRDLCVLQRACTRAAEADDGVVLPVHCADGEHAGGRANAPFYTV